MQAVGKKKNGPSSRALTTTSSMASNRKRKGGISPPTTVELRGVQIHFPFRPYKCQEEYMGKVLDALLRKENALLESPTGTGKTLCLLCATLAWQREQAKQLGDQSQQANFSASSQDSTTMVKKAPARVPTIIYASRTHSQLSQVVRELRSTRYRPRHAILGSREQMCVHPKVKKATSTATDINHDCNALAKERKCRFRNALEGFKALDAESNTQPVLDMEDLVSLVGRQNKVCPFYYTRSMVPDAELVLMPYNYLFDKDARDTTLAEINWQNAVVIFDEAHNLESFATDSASFDLTLTDLARCAAEVQRALTLLDVLEEDSHAVKRDNLDRMKGIFLHFEDYLNNLSGSGSFQGEYMMELLNRGMSISHGNHHLFVDECKKVSEFLLDASGSSSAVRGAPKLEHFAQCVKRVFGETTAARCMAKARSYRVHISPKGQQQSNNNNRNQQQKNRNNNNKAASSTRTLSYWCFAPSLAMQELENLKLRSIIVTSGTLSPLPSYSLELGIPFPQTLENPHIITDDQIHVRVIGRGVSGKELTSSFQRRKDGDYYAELGNTLVSLAKVIPAGMLVFFPSYSVMETCMERWGGPASSSSRFMSHNKNKAGSFFAARNKKGKNSVNRTQYSFPFVVPSMYAPSSNNPITPWKRLLGTKSVVVEPRATADLPDAIAEFHKYLAMPKSKGCLLIGICRGKISEGIDFSGEQSRAVVITGLPYPPAFDPKVKLKREYLDGARASKSIKSTEAGGFGGNSKEEAASAIPTSLSGSAWYNQQAHRACNQAIGRVIRNKDDYGAVLLLDSRYSQPGNQQGLSKWVRPHLQKDEGMGAAIGALAKFYRRAEAQAKEREEAKKGMIVLEYEQEEEQESKKLKQPQQANPDEAFTKVAFVQNLNRDLQQPKASSKDADASELEEDTGETVSYISPSRVLARVDVHKVVQERKKEAVFEDKSLLAGTKMKPKANGRQSVFASSAAQLMPMRPAIVNNIQSTRSTTAPKLDSKKAATLFFEKAKKWLTKAEFSSIRKALVAMKQHGDKKDEKSYLASAQQVINLCCQRESFFGHHELGHAETMLFLFFQLLPRAHRLTVETKAMVLLLRTSNFGKLCKTNLLPEQYAKVKFEFSKYLRWVWCDGGTQERTKFLEETQKVLPLLQGSNNKTVSSSLTTAFTKLVPSKFIASLQALTFEMEASRNIQQIKTKETRNKGEEAIELIRFQRTTAPTASRPKEPFAVKREGSTTAQTSRPKEPFAVKREPGAQASLANLKKRQAEATMKRLLPPGPEPKATAETKGLDPTSSQSSASSQGAKPVNPYAKKTKSLSSYISIKPSEGETDRTATSRKRQPMKPLPNHAPPAYSRKSELAQAGKPLPKHDPPAYSKTSERDSEDNDPVSNMLHQVESQPYVRKTTGDIVKTIESNVPENVLCVVCSKTASTPMLADCSHLACLECWRQWLKRSPTCPVCRNNVETKSLARVVFQDHPSYEATAPTLSEFCDD